MQPGRPAFEALFQQGQGRLAHQGELGLAQIGRCLLGGETQIPGADFADQSLGAQSIEWYGWAQARDQHQMQRIWPVTHQLAQQVVHLRPADGVVVIQDDNNFSWKLSEIIAERCVDYRLGRLLPRLEQSQGLLAGFSVNGA